MGNTNTDHSRKQRQQTAKARRDAIIAAGGKQLNTLLQPETARKLMFLREWHGTARGAATETDVIAKLINESYKSTAYKPLIWDSLSNNEGSGCQVETGATIQEDALARGYTDCAENKPITANPFPPESPLAREWETGWKQYDADYNSDYYSSPLAEDL